MEELPNGKYKFFERYKDPYTEKLKKVSVTMEKKTPQARNQAAILLQEKIKQKLGEKQHSVSNITFEKLYEEFEENWKHGVKNSTVYASKNVKKEILKQIEGDYLVRNIDRRLLQKVIDQLLQDGRSHNYVSKIKFKLNQIIKFAIRMNYIDTNEMLFVETPRKVITSDELRKKNTKYLDQKEFKLFIQNLKDEALCDYRITKYIRIAKVLFLTGMRYGELAALNYKEDINFSKKTIHIKHTYDFRQKERTTPKTIKSDRVITAPQKVLDIIKEQIIENATNGFDTDFIFINTLGEPITNARGICALKRHGQKIGIEKNITTHTFRHSHISLLAELGIPLTAIMDRVGHSDSKTTLEIYSHVTQKMVSDISSKLEKIKL
ncbi:site-specific integrase [Streptococcus pneumoniae]|uniref:tyrosine-type recombinase/integrase n=1 Tax=Streptococcus pneumoniae TaxID=1313 RepID=UPI001F4C8ED8|nr:site-specific integrase [Streptococcus pneumoniae]MDS2351255.1 site-specific integrase [Streptococcus pneumoniae]MDS2477429.1 site-specific integrase [Streptococcus pneumoniae]MDS2761696.1 site-specific integrase [Streptococcus pneumoniae]MDS2771531.1 site-specific integrase [Streptococcus pneumoniae]MDS2924693.1 site-specific integrase [Streptococcus pneumoniae]